MQAAQEDHRQGWLKVSAEVATEVFRERREKPYEAGFTENHRVLHPALPSPPGQEPNHLEHLLKGEIAWMRTDLEPNGQQEPVIVSAFSGESVSVDEAGMCGARSTPSSARWASSTTTCASRTARSKCRTGPQS